MRSNSEIDNGLRKISEYSVNDIVIYLSRRGKCSGIQGYHLEEIFEKFQIISKWVTDRYMHCNNKVNRLIADNMVEMIEPWLIKDVIKNNDNKAVQIDIHDVMKKYIKHKYLDHYFINFPKWDYNTIGAIIMNCNPFSRGHQYLIEQAARQVEFLIIFVVEEDESLFPFEERFKLIVEGTKYLNNIMVVPSGEFILSKNNFQEYFTKQINESVAFNAEYDINVFADYIAEPLHITHRFAGEEPEDQVTKIYNETMRRVLPHKGVTFVEIPRIVVDSEVVSASIVRKYLKDAEYGKAFALLPETTIKYLMKQI